jgi:endonuclease/exonuclease/phosphatase family metal-dependent hydrolase
MLSRAFRVLTLNTWKNEGNYESRLAVLARELGTLRADFVLLQECFRTCGPRGVQADTAQHLAAALGAHLTYAPARRKPRTWSGAPVESESGLAILSPLAPNRATTLALPSSDVGGERIALLADYDLGGHRIILGNLHLSHVPEEHTIRRAQLDTVLASDWWETPADLKCIGGDFNAVDSSIVFHAAPAKSRLRLQSVFAGRSPCPATHPLPATPDGPAAASTFSSSCSRTAFRRQGCGVAGAFWIKPVGVSGRAITPP